MDFSVASFRTVGRKPRRISPSGCGERREGDFVTNRKNRRRVNLIDSPTGAPRPGNRSSPVAANAGIRLSKARLDVPEESEATPAFIAPTQM